MMETGETAAAAAAAAGVEEMSRDWGAAVAIGGEKVTIKRQEEDLGQGRNWKLFQLMKEERYVDVTLQFQDGKRLSCHR